MKIDCSRVKEAETSDPCLMERVPAKLDYWEPFDALRVNVPGLVAAYDQAHQLHLLH